MPNPESYRALAQGQTKTRFNRLLGVCFLAYLIYVLVHWLGGHPQAVKIHALAALATAFLWLLGSALPAGITLASHLNLVVGTIALSAHAWNGALINDSAWFLTLIPLFAAYQLGPRQAIVWMVVVTMTLIALPLLASVYQPQPEWILSQGEVDRNRVMLVLFMSAFAVASARATQSEGERAERWGRRLVATNERLVQTNDALQRSNLDLENLASILCHDLKSPLRGITGCLQVLQLSLPSLNEEDRETFDHVLSSAERMTQLIDALNAYSKATTISTEKTEVSMDKLLLEVEADLAYELENGGAKLVKETELGTEFGYTPLLRQLWQNLISNAIKFQPEKAKPIVRVGRRADRTFYVADNGIGMSEKNYQRIFSLYDRLDTDGQFEGSGIGLAVCARVVALHHGKIWVESTPGQGSTFLLTLAPDPAPT